MLVAIDLQTACTLQASHHPCLPWSCGSACISSTPPPRVAFFWLQTAYWIKTSGFSASTSKPSIRAACCTGRSSSNFTLNEMWGKRQSWNLLDSHGHSKLQPPSCIPTSCTTNYCIQIDISWFWYFMYDIQFENIQCIFMKWKKIPMTTGFLCWNLVLLLTLVPRPFMVVFFSKATCERMAGAHASGLKSPVAALFA